MPICALASLSRAWLPVSRKRSYRSLYRLTSEIRSLALTIASSLWSFSTHPCKRLDVCPILSSTSLAFAFRTAFVASRAAWRLSSHNRLQKPSQSGPRYWLDFPPKKTSPSARPQKPPTSDFRLHSYSISFRVGVQDCAIPKNSVATRMRLAPLPALQFLPAIVPRCIPPCGSSTSEIR